MATPVKRISDPSTELIDTESAKGFLREGANAQDSVIDELVITARELLEDETGRNFGESDYELYLEGFHDFTFPRSPVDTDSVVITYNNDVELATDNYTLINEEDPARIVFKGSLPTLDDDQFYPVKIAFTSGYTSSNVPKRALTAMKLLMSFYYSNRDPGSDKVDYSIPIPKRIRHFIDPLKPRRFH